MADHRENENPRLDTGRGIGAARIGAIAGLVPAIGLGVLRVLNLEPPEAIEQLAGTLALVLVYGSPYVLTLMACRVPDSATRGGLLVSLGLLSLVASFSSLSLVTVALLPATALIWLGAVRSLSCSGRPLHAALPMATVGLFIAGLVGFGFFALLLMQDPESRCWVLAADESGQYHWESRPNVGGPGELSSGNLGWGVRRSSCTSDVITNAEAAMASVSVAVALLFMWMLCGRRSRTSKRRWYIA